MSNTGKEYELEGYDKQSIEALLNNLPEDAFDGHTEFENLTPDQKLDWRAAAVQFWFKYGKPRGS